MPRVPQYQEGQVQHRNLPGVQFSTGASPEAFGAGIGRGLQQVGQLVQGIAEREQEKADITAVMSADRELADLELRLFHDPENGAYNKRGRDSFGLPESVMPQWDQSVRAIEGRLSPRQLEAFRRQAETRRQDLTRGLYRHISQESERFYEQESQAYVAQAADSAAANYTDPDRIALEVERARRGALSLDDGASPIVVQQRVQEAESLVYARVVKRRMNDDVAGAVSYFDQIKDRLSPGQLAALEPEINEARKAVSAFAAADRAMSGAGVGSTFDSAVQEVLDIEGGYVADDAGKGETNFGINITANPDIDVKNLTPEQAKQIYKERYWDAIDADSLPAELRGMAFDAAVNQGVGNARKWIKESGGDPEVFLQLRAAHYESLIEQDPGKFSQYAEGWENRLARFQPQAGGAATLSESLSRLRGLDPEVRKLAEARVRQEWQAREEAERAASEQRLNEGYDYLQSGGSLADMPPELRSRLNPKEYAALEQYDRVRRQGAGAVQTDEVVYAGLLDQMVSQPLKFAQVSLVEYRNKLSEDEYRRLQQAQVQIKAGRPTALQAERKLVNDVAMPVLSELGLARRVKGSTTQWEPIGGEEGKKRYAAFSMAIQREVDAFRAASGKDPTVDDVQAMVDRLVMTYEVEVPGMLWGTNSETRFMFEAPLPPRDAAMRQKGTVYSTPRGPLLWTGTGWTTPNQE